MNAFFGKHELKQKYVDRMKAHIAADRLIAGTGYDGFKGCSIGCTFEKYDHSKYRTDWDVCEKLAHLNDAIFEGLPDEKRQAFALEFIEAIPVGADTSNVWITCAIARHERSLVLLEKNTEPYAQECRDAIWDVIEWLKKGASKSRSAELAELAWSEWAWSAAEWARSAARSAAWSARSATCSAESADSAAVASSAYEDEAKVLINALRALKVEDV